MKRRYFAYVLATVLALTTTASAEKLSPPPDATSKVDKIFAQFNRKDSPGCTAGATIDGATVLSTAYGMADLEHNVPLTPDSVIEGGSVSKQFTAAAVLLLAQQGKVSLDDPVRKYLPEVPDYGTPLTIRHMLTHTSGLRDWGNVEAIAGWPRTSRAYTHAHVLDIVSRQRALNFTPGADYSYSNTGFNLLAIIVGRVSGKPFPDFTRESIFGPLGMSSTQWRDDYRRIVPNRAIAYAQTGDSIRMLMPFESVFGNGGLLTTVGDLLKWNQNFTDAKVGGRKFTEAQQQQGRLNDGRRIAYAAGLFIEDWKGLREVSHSGATAGYRAWLGRYPDQGLSVAILCNTATANTTDLGHRIAEVYLGSAIPKALPDSPVNIDLSALESKAGMYASVRDHRVAAIDLKDGQLQLGQRVLKPISSNRFRLGDAFVDFESNASGKTARMRVVTGEDQNDYYEKVQPSKPTTADMEQMTGEYASDEAETTLKVAFENGHLVLHRRPDGTIPLTPTYRDAFNSPNGSVRFIRDAGGRISEVSLGDGRVWDLRLKRVRNAR